MTSGKDEFYLLYPKGDENNYYLATYSETANAFVSDVKIDCAVLGDMICNYNGELLLAGRTTEPKHSREFDIVKLYSDSGHVYENFGNFPDFDIDFNDVAAGKMSVYDNKIYIGDVYDSFKRDTEHDEEAVDYGGPVIYDGNSWAKGDDTK